MRGVGLFVFAALASGAFATQLTLTMVADDFFEAYVSTDDSVQGTLFNKQTGTWQAGAQTGSITLTPGVTNYLHIQARDVFGAPSMILGQATLSDGGFLFGNGTDTLLTNGADWKVSLTGFGSNYQPVVDLGKHGTMVWGSFSGISSDARHIWSNQTAGEQYFSIPIRSVVPEPATMAVLAAGVAGLVRRRKKA
ncbi:MAG: PEP-CTERM sorting domain-containing protein [Armatimonadetes bacterium]|nr:PEP-CTERM sorting domain-containing protein [Armatimonadota bacterium]